MLAQRLKWPFALPLLAAPLLVPAGRGATTEIGDGAETPRVLFACAKAATHACDLAAELGLADAKIGRDGAGEIVVAGLEVTNSLIDR